MQPRGRGRNGTWPGGKDRLIPFAIGGFVFAVDVRWKRHVAQPRNLRGYSAGIARTESYGAQPEFAARDDLRFQLAIAKHYALPGFHLAARAHQCLPQVRTNLPREKNLHRAA